MSVTEKAKTVEEKFQKLKEVYRKVREEHIQLIRQVSNLVLTLNSKFIGIITLFDHCVHVITVLS